MRAAKTDVISHIELVEKEYDVGSIKLGKIRLWPFLRKFFFLSHLDRPVSYGVSSLKKKLRRLFNIFYNSRNLFGNYEYFIFSSGAISRVNIDGKYYDKYCDAIYERYSTRALFIESGSNVRHYKKGELPRRKILSGDLIVFS